MFDPDAQKKAAQRSVKKMKPLINNTSKSVFSMASVKVGKKLNLSKNDICKNIERKHGSKEARRIFKTL